MLAHVQYTRKLSSKNLGWKFCLQFEEMGDLVVTKHRKAQSKSDDFGTNGEVEDMTRRDKQDGGQTSIVNGLDSGEVSHFVQSDSAKSCMDVDTIGADMDGMSEYNKQGASTENVFDSHKRDGLQELLQLAREFESEEASKKGLDDGYHPQNEGFSEGHSPKQKVEQNLCVKEDVNSASNQKASMEVCYSEEAGLKNIVSERENSVTRSLSQQSKAAPTGDQRTFHCKEVPDIGQACASENRRRSRSASLTSITIGPSRSQFTIPKPFSLATDKRAQGGGRPREDESGQQLQKAHGVNEAFSDPHSKTPEISRRLYAKLHVAKSIRSESIKHQEDTLKKLTIRANPEHQDEDTMSISSIKSSSYAPKAKASRFTSTSSFKFQSDARAEKRKEYYSQLQERLSAKEEEMNQMQAKAKKEKDEEIKLLRRSLTFKASPMPGFYQEGPPPQAELPKTPTTRAKSPNFSRRDSHSGFGGSTRLCNTIRCEAEHRSSLSPQKPGKRNDAEVLGSDDYTKRFLRATSLSESPKENPTEGKTSSSGSALELLDVEISVSDGAFEDLQAKVRDPLTVSSELMMSDEEGKAHVVQITESTHIIRNGDGDKVYQDKIKPRRCKETSAVMDSFGRPDFEANGRNVLKGRGNANAGVLLYSSNKTKCDRKVPLAHDDSEDMSAQAANKSIKKQRLKALTPYFRKRDSTRNEGQSMANKEMPYENANATVGSE